MKPNPNHSEQLNAALKNWRVTPPLTPRQRQLWTQAARETGDDSPRFGLTFRLIAALGFAVVSLVVIVLFLRPSTPSRQFVRPNPEVPRDVVVEINPADELSRLAASAAQLDVTIHQLRIRAERVEARSQVALALDRYGRW